MDSRGLASRTVSRFAVLLGSLVLAAACVHSVPQERVKVVVVDEATNVQKCLETLAVPDLLGQPEVFPMVPTYLDMFTSENLAKYYDRNGNISSETKRRLRTLFLACRQISVRNREDYFVQLHRPIMKLMAKAYPKVLQLDTEPDGGVRLSGIATVIAANDQEETRRQRIRGL
jgi:hypothetical protein